MHPPPPHPPMWTEKLGNSKKKNKERKRGWSNNWLQNYDTRVWDRWEKHWSSHIVEVLCWAFCILFLVIFNSVVCRVKKITQDVEQISTLSIKMYLIPLTFEKKWRYSRTSQKGLDFPVRLALFSLSELDAEIEKLSNEPYYQAPRRPWSSETCNKGW